MNEVLH